MLSAWTSSLSLQPPPTELKHMLLCFVQHFHYHVVLKEDIGHFPFKASFAVLYQPAEGEIKGASFS